MPPDLKIEALIEILLKDKGAKEAAKVMETLSKESRKTGDSLSVTAKKMIIAEREAKKLSDANRGLKDSTKAAAAAQDKQAASTKKLSSTMAGYVGRVAALFGLYKAISIARRGVFEYAKEERMLSAISDTMDNMGISAEKNLPRVQQFLLHIERSGNTYEDTNKAFQKFLGLTGSVGGAMAAVSLANDTANKGLGEFSTNVESLAGIFMGRGSFAAKNFGLSLEDVNGKLVDDAGLLRQLIALHGDFGEEVSDTQARLDELKSTMDQTQRTIGSGFSRIAGFLSGLLEGTVKTVQSIGAAIGGLISAIFMPFQELEELSNTIKVGLFDVLLTGFNGVASVATKFGAVLKAALTPTQLGSVPGLFAEMKTAVIAETANLAVAVKDAGGEAFEGLKTAQERALTGIIASVSGAVDEIKAIWGDAGGAPTDDETSAGREALIQAAATRARQRAMKEAEKLREQELEREKQFQEEKAKAAAEAVKTELRTRAEAHESGSRERLDLELQLLEIEKQERIKAAEAVEGDITAVRLAAELERTNKLIKFAEAQESKRRAAIGRLGDAEAEAEQANIEKQIALRESLNQMTFDLQMQAIERKIEADKAAVQAEIEAEQARIDRKTELAEKEMALFGEINTQARERAEQEKAEIAEIGQARIAAITAKGEAALVKIGKASQEAKAKQYEAAAESIIGSLQTIFGESKALAIAEAIIQTYQGVAMALGAYPPPFNFIAAGFVAAAGAKNVADIVRTNIGSTSASSSIGGGGVQATKTVRNPSRYASSGNPIESFADGGEVSGPMGVPRMVVAHGGEVITPKPPRPAVMAALLRSYDQAGAGSGSSIGPGGPADAALGGQFDQSEHFHFNGVTLLGNRSDMKEFVREFRRVERQVDPPREMR